MARSVKITTPVPSLEEFGTALGLSKARQRSLAPVFVERRPDGSYAVQKRGANRASSVFSTQRKAIERAKDLARQRPDATRVAPIVGVRRKKNEEANKDITKQNERVLVGFRNAYVFDVSQTFRKCAGFPATLARTRNGLPRLCVRAASRLSITPTSRPRSA